MGSEGFLTQPGKFREYSQGSNFPPWASVMASAVLGSHFALIPRPTWCPHEPNLQAKTLPIIQDWLLNQVLLRACTMLKYQLQLCSTGWCHASPFHEGSNEKPVQKGQEELRSSLALPSIGSDSGIQQEPDCKNTGQVSLVVTEPISSVKIGIMVPTGCSDLHRG